MESFPSRRQVLKLAAAAGMASLASPASAHGELELTNALDHDQSRRDSRGNENGLQMMPTFFGPAFSASHTNLDDMAYHDVAGIAINYRTDNRTLRGYVPKQFEIGDEPVITVSYSMYKQVDWLAGQGYNVISVSTPAKYQGTKDEVEGDFALVLWENRTEPILVGREFPGFPKIYGDIQDHRIHDGSWRTALSHSGHPILDLNASELKALSTEEHESVQESMRASNTLTWKYLPNESGSAPVESCAILYPYSTIVQRAWNAVGHVQWHPQTWKQNPTQWHIVNSLESLPVKEITSCLVWTGSLKLHVSRLRRLS